MTSLILSEGDLKKYTLAEIEKLLRSHNKTLADFPPMPLANVSLIDENHNRLIYDELNYDKKALVADKVELLSKMTLEQRNIYATILNAVKNDKGFFFFFYGHGGTGKTFLW